MAIFLALTYAFAACGLADVLHRADEARHDTHECSICVNLHMPTLAGDVALTLGVLGLLIVFVAVPDAPVLQQSFPFKLACRGPPACS